MMGDAAPGTELVLMPARYGLDHQALRWPDEEAKPPPPLQESDPDMSDPSSRTELMSHINAAPAER